MSNIHISVRLHVSLQRFSEQSRVYQVRLMDDTIRKRTRRSMTAVRIWLEHSLAEVYVYVTTDTGIADIKSVNMISRPHDP